MLDSMQLNQEQQKAVNFGLEASTPSKRPLLIIAGAGTGKTNTLAHKTAQLILNGTSPDRILLMTFARRAAGELSSRANKIVTQELSKIGKKSHAIKITWMGTFHSIAARLLREHATAIGLNSD